MKKTKPKQTNLPEIENSEETEQALLALQPADPHARKMYRVGVARLTRGGAAPDARGNI